MKTGDFTINFLTDADNYYLSNNNNLDYKKSATISLNEITLYHVKEITFEDKAPRKEALENVIGSLRIEGINFIYVILGNEKCVNFYFGVVRDLYAKKPLIETYDIGEFVLLPSLKGNFRGSSISYVENEEKEKIINAIHNMENACYLEGVPGVNEDNENFQGVDRLVDVMLGDEFAVVVIAKPLLKEDFNNIETNLNKAYSGIIPFVKETVQDGMSKNSGTNTSKASSSNQSAGENYSTSEQVSSSTNKSETTGTSKGTSTTVTDGRSSGSSSNSTGKTGNEGSNKNSTFGSSNSESTSKTSGTNVSKGTSTSITEGESRGESTSQSKTVEFIKKEVQDWIKYLDDTIFTRLDYGKGKGLFLTTTLLLTEQVGSLLKLENTMKSLYSGESGNKVALNEVKLDKKDNRLKSFLNFQIPKCDLKQSISSNEIYARSTLSQYLVSKSAFLGNWISTKELSLIAGLPQKEIVGLGLREEVEFGLNFGNNNNAEEGILLGNIVQSGNVLKISVPIEREVLNKHIFVTGVTGSGKTTTCQKILIDSNLPFLVIEPAKTEYRILTNKYEDLLIFTLGCDTVSPFRLNPFEFFPHENITSRVDMIKASIEANFHMEAAIPQIIETAIYECYEDYGWNISNNKNSLYENPFDDGVFAFPTISDLIKKTESVVEKQGFDARLKMDYMGSIKARLQGLTVGAKGHMLDTKRSVDFKELLHKHVVLELEEVRSSAEKALIIGFVLTNLIEAVKAEFFANPTFKHITLIEEAHRLLSRFSAGDSLNKKQSVETFTDMLAEVRKYGECLVIADQIPSKLAPEVLKNTNTKIVHKIFAQDDKEAIGNTMALTDDQKGFLSNLNVGRAILFTQGYNKAIQVQISRTTDTTSTNIVKENTLRENVLKYYCETFKRGIFQGVENLEFQPSVEYIEKIIELNADSEFKNSYEKYLSTGEISESLTKKIEYYNNENMLEALVLFVLNNYYVLFSAENKKSIKKTLHKVFQYILGNDEDILINQCFNKLKNRGV